MKCRGPKRNRNRFAIGKGRSLAMESRTVDHMVASVYANRDDRMEGYVPRPKVRTEVWRRSDEGGK
jgi:hypothetical protein